MHTLCAYLEIGKEGELFDLLRLYLPVPHKSFKEVLLFAETDRADTSMSANVDIVVSAQSTKPRNRDDISKFDRQKWRFYLFSIAQTTFIDHLII
jgi:hypothetical protein